MRRLVILLCLIMMVILAGVPAAAASTRTAIDQLQLQAEADGYRFIQVGENGITDEIRQSLVTEDDIYIESTPKGSVTVQVLDLATGKPIADARCLLSYSTMIYTVNTDGNREQKANPFLLFDLGVTPKSGELKYGETYFTASRPIESGTPPYADGLTVHLAYIVDPDPELVINSQADNYIATSDPDNFQAIVDGLNGRTSLKFSEFKAIINQVASQKYAEIVRYLFDGKFAMFSDTVQVRIADAPQFQQLIDSGRRELPLAELREYVAENHDLFKEQVADRYYADYGGFEPDFALQHKPGYDSMTTYKDGTQKMVTGRHYLGLKIFDQVTGGTGYAINSTGFNYRAYVYAEGYGQGKAIGGIIRQDHVDTDITFRFYLSKDLPPVAVQEGFSAVAGTLVNEKGQPISGATISLAGADQTATTDEKGCFSFTRLKNEKVTLAITNPENGEPLLAKVIYQGQEYPLDAVPFNLTGSNQIFSISVISGASAAAGASSTPLWPVLILAFVLLIVVLLIILLLKRRKHVCRQCGSSLSKEARFCGKCGSAQFRNF